MGRESFFCQWKYMMTNIFAVVSGYRNVSYIVQQTIVVICSKHISLATRSP